MEKSELAAVIGGALTVIVGLIGAVYASVTGRIARVEKRQEDESAAVWGAIDGQREDTKTILREMTTKDDLRASEQRIMQAFRGGHAD